MIGQLGTDLAPLIISLPPSIKTLADGLGKVLSAQAGTLIGMLPQLLPPLVGLAIKLSPADRTGGPGVGEDARLGDSDRGPRRALDPELWKNVVEPAFNGMAKVIRWLYDNAIKPLWNDWIKPVFDDIRSGVDLVTQHWSTVWANMTAGFKAPVNFLIGTVYDHGIARLWNDVVGAVGLNSIKLPVIATLAGGGVLPGYSPGRTRCPPCCPRVKRFSPRAPPGPSAGSRSSTRSTPPTPRLARQARRAGYSLGGIVSGLLPGGAGHREGHRGAGHREHHGVRQRAVGPDRHAGGGEPRSGHGRHCRRRC